MRRHGAPPGKDAYPRTTVRTLRCESSTAGTQPLAEVHLRLAVVVGVSLEFDHFEPQRVERSPHVEEPVLGLDHDLVEAGPDRPHFLLLGEGPEVALAAPVAAGGANPAVEHPAADEVDGVAEPLDQVVQLRVALVEPNLVPDLVGHRHDLAGIVGQRRLGHQDDVVAVAETPGDFGRGLAPAELPEPLLDVLDLQRTLFEVVVADQVFHGGGVRRRRPEVSVSVFAGLAGRRIVEVDLDVGAAHVLDVHDPAARPLADRPAGARALRLGLGLGRPPVAHAGTAARTGRGTEAATAAAEDRRSRAAPGAGRPSAAPKRAAAADAVRSSAGDPRGPALR